MAWPTALGTGWSDSMELCCHIAELAEQQAEEHFAKQAAKKAAR